MARQNSYGYYALSTNKYGGDYLHLDQGPWYGGRQGGDTSVSSWHMYGLNYPPPVPTDLTVEYWPVTPDHTPLFMWNATPLEVETLTYQIEINFLANDFTSPTTTTIWFSAIALGGTRDWAYELPIEQRLVAEGTYYARIRSSDGFTYSGWSDVLEFEYRIAPPPPPTIDPVTSPTDQFVQIICGGKAPATYVFIRNNEGEWYEVDYTYGIAGGRWCYIMTLEAGVNNIEAIASWSTSTTTGISSPATAVIHTIFNTPEPYNVWNCFDELGMLVSLDRITGEKNKAYKKRILDVFENPGNSTYQGLINAISRELDIDASGISVYRLSDLADPDASGNILNADGNAIGTKLEEYVDEVYSHNPIFWGNLVADESRWDSIDEEYTGVSYLPHLWDPTASGVYNKWQKTGIGDQDDLWVKDAVKILDPSGNVYGSPVGTGMMEASGVLRNDDVWRLPVHSGYFYVTEPSGSYYWS